MVSPKDQARALKYRRLALTEIDEAKATLLRTLAEEAERGVLCTPDRITNGNSELKPGSPRSVS